MYFILYMCILVYYNLLFIKINILIWYIKYRIDKIFLNIE